jgi:hypothetical protein
MVDLLAAATSGATSIEGIFLQYGLIGAIALVLGVYAKRAIDATEQRARRLEDDNRRLYQIMADQMIPALTKATDAVADATAVITEIRRRDEINAAVEAARRARDSARA